jgi:hypothetical protein
MKDCKFCDKTGLLILPLRYAVLVDDDASRLMPEMPGTLGVGVKDLALTHARYAARLVREGFIYALIQRAGVKYWEAYAVTEDAFLYKFRPEEPPTTKIEFTCDRSSCGIDASCIAVDKVETVERMYFLFTPSALTAAKLDEYKAKAEAFVDAGKMQAFDPKGWAKAGSRAQAHSLKPEQLAQHVPEWVLYGQCEAAWGSALGKAMARQLFPAINAAYAGLPAPAPNEPAPGRLGLLQHKLRQQQGAAFVMYDHIGITQELNDFRNAALHPIEEFLERRKDGADNQWRLEVKQAIDDVKASFKKQAVALALKQMALEQQRSLPDIDAQNAKTLRSLGRTQEAQALEDRVQRRKEAGERARQRRLSGAEAEERWRRVYQPLLDSEEIERFDNELTRISKNCEEAAARRAPDHARWVTSDRLVDAFDVFDPDHLGSGFEFAREHLHCTFGMFGVKANQPKLEQWVAVEKVERKNLYMRANLYNHDALIAEAEQAFQQVKRELATAGGLTAVASPPILKATKGLIDVLKKADSAWDEWLRDKAVKDVQLGRQTKAGSDYQKGMSKLNTPVQKLKYQAQMKSLSQFHRSCEGLMLRRIGELSQVLMTKRGLSDALIQAVAGTLLYGKLGRLAEEIGFAEYFLDLKNRKLAKLTAKPQLTPEYQERADAQKRAAPANVKRVEAQASAEASARARAEAAKVDGSIDVLLHDEQNKMARKVKLTLEQLDHAERPETNNFRQARLGTVLMALEGVALYFKLHHEGELSERAKAEVAASVLSLAGMSFDLGYAVMKSLREIQPYESMKGVNKAADVLRGGLKISAGMMSAAAGGIGAVLDGTSGVEELKKEQKNWVLASIYFARGGLGAWNAGLGLVAAFSYTAPLLTRLSSTGWAAIARLAPSSKELHSSPNALPSRELSG